MRINAQIAATMLVFTAILLSGCMDASDTDDATLDQADGAGDDAEDLSGNITNTAPVADLVPDVTSGEAPLTVNFTIEASDEDGDNVTWAIDFDNDTVADQEGNTTEAVVNHTFDSAGNHTVTLTVSDGTNTTSEQVVIEVVEAVVEEAESQFPLELVLTVDEACAHCWVVYDATGALEGCASYTTGQPGIDCDWQEIPAESAGLPFTAEAGDADAIFLDTCDGSVVEGFDNEGNEEGTVPEGAGCVLVWDFLESGDIIVRIG